MLDEEHKLFLKKKEKFENGLQRDQERIQSEQQIQSKYELVKQQYTRLNEQKTKIHQLFDYYDQTLKINEDKSSNAVWRQECRTRGIRDLRHPGCHEHGHRQIRSNPSLYDQAK